MLQRIIGAYRLDAIAQFSNLDRHSRYIFSVFSDPQLAASKELKVMLLKSRDGSRHEEAQTTFCEPEEGVVGDVATNQEINIGTDDLSGLFNQSSEFNFDLGSLDI